VAYGKVRDLIAAAIEKRIVAENKGARSDLDQSREGGVDLACCARVKKLGLPTKGKCGFLRALSV
jgi:hypothetical protein